MNTTLLRNVRGIWATISLCVLSLLAVSCVNESPVAEPINNEPTTLEDLEGKSVAVITGSTSDVLLSDSNNFSNITIVRCDSPTELMKAVYNGQAEYGVSDTVVLMNLSCYDKQFEINFNLTGGFDMAVAFAPNNTKLCDKFNMFLIQIKSDGTWDDMIDRWCRNQVDSTTTMPVLEQPKGRPIEVATLADNLPFCCIKDNVPSGLEAEMMMRFAQYINKPVHFSAYNFNEIIGVLRSGKADVAAANISITPDRADQVLFSHPYYFCKTCCFSLSE